MKNLLVFIFLISANAYAQRVDLKIDTITIFQLNVVGESNFINPPFTIFKIGANFYDGENFPFDCYMCEQYGLYDNALFRNSYQPLLNEKQLTKFTKNFGKVVSHLANLNGTDISAEIDSCLSSKQLKFVIKKKKFVAVYFILECKNRKGVSSPVFCDDVIKMTEIPVILTILKTE